MSKKFFIFLISGVILAGAFFIVQAAPTFDSDLTFGASTTKIIFTDGRFLDRNQYDGNAATATYAATAGTATGATNALTADALSADPANCNAGFYPLGIAADGSVESCTEATAGSSLWASSSDDIYSTNSGDVGIGVTSPTYKLDVQSAVNNVMRLVGGSNAYLSLSGATDYQSVFYLGRSGNNAKFTFDDSMNTLYLQNQGAGGIMFGTATSAEPVWINSDNNVGIGIMSPGNKLEVAGGGLSVSGSYSMPVGSAVTLSQESTYGQFQSWNSKPLYINPLGNNVIFNRDSGNVGIGLTNPSYKLDVSGAVNATSMFINGAVVPSLKTNTAAIGADGWYRIASNGPTSDGGTGGAIAYGRFVVWHVESGKHCFADFTVGYEYSTSVTSPTIVLNNSSCYNGSDTPITSIRAVAGDTYEGGAVEVYIDVTSSASVYYQIYDQGSVDPASNGSGSWTPVDWTAGSIWTGATASTVNIATTDAIIGGASGGGTDEFYITRDGAATFAGVAANGGLSQDGNVILNGGDTWLRTTSATGWYNQTYGGGWYMTDTSWIRNYNSKPLYMTGNGTTAATFMSGKVGIGTTAPAVTLDVRGSVDIGNGIGAATLRLMNTTGGTTGYFEPASSLFIFGGNYVSDSNLVYLPSGMRLKAGSSLVLTASTGDVTAVTFTYASDRKLKNNIKTLNNSLNKILQLRGVSFDWKDSGKSSVGLIAQEVENVFPELVSQSENGYKAIQYGNLIAPLIEAVKEQQKEIDKLNTRISILEAQK